MLLCNILTALLLTTYEGGEVKEALNYRSREFQLQIDTMLLAPIIELFLANDILPALREATV